MWEDSSYSLSSATVLQKEERYKTIGSYLVLLAKRMIGKVNRNFTCVTFVFNYSNVVSIKINNKIKQ